jgi:hypothetical protein
MGEGSSGGVFVNPGEVFPSLGVSVDMRSLCEFRFGNLTNAAGRVFDSQGITV